MATHLDNRHEVGMKKLNEFTDTNSAQSTHEKIAESLKDIAPAVGEWITDFAYGEVYSRNGLVNRDRAIVTIASLVTQGTEPQLALHINTGLTAGLTGNEIVEAIMHLVPYTGFPRVLNALEVAKVVFAERGVTVDPA
ncbi:MULTISPECIES: carboxymuconolactone decarboxylase family protein [Exiguobacterium]|uniref:Carboxymuconolactone decarboxylase family protein n=1 Tax=Exiguobacterium antarcticum TaxID=132920 RepID=A0ABT6R285_9BACL|nr:MULTISPECIES: carboxymuconolactone decarboxylase family protein [Exiguobacterium]AFS71753.1 Carboxymuconolactone decarboxylase [Exiguobacterium antarcticum B7]MCT4779231.1 carboxymuconolactone decarboxylase family protein [Exiguobacterium soli]MDI3235044.1 carboxymuconolactone decarboxylase family protein [Exiguobacterium antarcticum]